MSESYTARQRKLVQLIKQGSAGRSSDFSIVDIRADYENDPERCLTTVVFIPVEVSDKLLQTIIHALKRIEPEHHYYQPASMHMTVKNIRKLAVHPTYTELDIREADRVLADRIPRHPVIGMMFEDVAVFRTSISLIAYSDERFGCLVQDLDAGLKEIGLADDKQYISDSVFFGNVTFCRFVHPPSQRFISFLQEVRQDLASPFRVQEVHLVESNAVCSASTVRRVNSYRLAGN